jgi:hypothetical protein
MEIINNILKYLNIDEIFKAKLDINKNFYDLDYLNIFSLIIIIIIIFSIIKSENKFFTIIIIILLLYSTLFFINQKLLLNKYFSSKYISYDTIKSELNTGDIVFFKYSEYDRFSYILTTLFYSLVQSKYYFTHVGIIYKDPQGKIFIIESNEKPYFCNINKKEKPGFQLIDFDSRIKNNTTHRIHIVKNNINEYLDTEKLNISINKYKNFYFNQEGVDCLALIINILQENNLLKEKIYPYIFEDLLEPSNYTVPIFFEKPILIKDYNE